jgi:hypothetical protein
MQARHDDDMGMDMDGDAMACSMHML